ncbi:caspase family protein [Bradyrhizobium ivorense]|uniref:caspase family protein n=1 Tax=Bradyrhizobium ivorense TaxID=2511166 RepID=UPI0010B6083C|nr:caspase family protein [Bradyrhizobium ivorense]VIO80841.1 hypothetical protein CI41S_75510 [Bradyrhizobium ivorense]
MKRAMLIASSTFLPDSGIDPLRFVVNDVEAMETTLRGDGFGFEINKLVNVYDSAAREALSEWVSKASYDDLILIYYSGHGLLSRGRELFLTCANTKRTNLLGTALDYGYLTKLIREHSLQKVAIILDCCYAGRAIEGMRTDLRTSVAEQVNAVVMEPGSGVFFLGASGRNQVAQERERDGHGILTAQIIEGLSSGDADIDGDGNISAKDLATYVKRKLRQQNAEQEPIEGGAYKGELILGTNRRKQLQTALAAIGVRLEASRSNFRRATFRKIEDYLDDISNKDDFDAIVLDPKYLALSQFATENASVEEVVAAFADVNSGTVSTEQWLADKIEAAAAPKSLSVEVSSARTRTALVRWPRSEAVDPPIWYLSLAGAVGALLASGMYMQAHIKAPIWEASNPEYAASVLAVCVLLGALAEPLRRQTGVMWSIAILFPTLVATRLFLAGTLDAHHQHDLLANASGSIITALGIALPLAIRQLWAMRQGES